MERSIIPMNSFVFDPINHRYFYDGIEIPSVSKIIGGNNVPNNRYALNAINKGIAIHKQLENYDKSILKTTDTIYKSLWKEYIDKNNYKIVKIEFMFLAIIDNMQYAGCVDRLLIDDGGSYILLDFKTGNYHKQYALQMVAYKYGLEQFLKIKINICKLLFLKNGISEYILNAKKDEFNLFIFKKLLQQFYVKENLKLKTEVNLFINHGGVKK